VSGSRRDRRGFMVSFNPVLAGLHAQVQVLEARQKEMQESLRRSFSESSSPLGISTDGQIHRRSI
jgi:hypothetical protein